MSDSGACRGFVSRVRPTPGVDGKPCARLTVETYEPRTWLQNR